MKGKEKDGWDKAGVILHSVGSFLTALAVAGLGFFGSQFLEKRQAAESNMRLYTELMSKREASESDLRKDMFKSIIESFLKSGTVSTTEAELEAKTLNLELLTYNFHESLNLKPLFMHLKRQIDFYMKKDKQGYLARLEKVAREITRKQMLILEGAGKRFDRTIDFDELRKHPGGILLNENTLTLNEITRDFKIFVLKADPKTKEIKVRMEIITPKGPEEIAQSAVEFWVGFFDFPMIDNTRLLNGQRCAIVLNAFEKTGAEVTVIYFPGSYASLKDKPYYEEVLQNLKLTSKKISEIK